MWQSILRHYDTHHRPRVENERSWFASSASLDDAINKAALALDQRGKRFSHQRRIPKQVLQEARGALLAAKEEIKNARGFDDLLLIVTDHLRDVHGTGTLYAYDAALRISYYLNLLPTTVYLHAGTKAGAKTLGLSLNKPFLAMSELPSALRGRPAHEIEDILCIYKDQFAHADENVNAPGCT
jgi:hypothetical protein